MSFPFRAWRAFSFLFSSSLTLSCRIQIRRGGKPEKEEDKEEDHEKNG